MRSNSASITAQYMTTAKQCIVSVISALVQCMAPQTHVPSALKCNTYEAEIPAMVLQMKPRLTSL